VQHGQVFRGWVGGGVKNETMEETVDAALQTELNRQENIVISDTEEQVKESRKTDENTNESRSRSIKRSESTWLGIGKDMRKNLRWGTEQEMTICRE